MDTPLVSAIIPTKNSASTIKACLKSIKEQTYKNIEIIVVDNSSADKTTENARKFTEKVFDKGPERSAQRNFGAANAKGSYLLFIDSDMELSIKVIEECVEKIKSDSNIKGIIIPEESFGIGFWAECKKLERSFYVGQDSIEAARFFDMQTFDQVTGYCEDLIAGEDWNLSDRVEEVGKIARIGSYIYHNEGKISLWKTLKKKYYYASKAQAYIKHSKQVKMADKRKMGIIGRYGMFLSQPIKLFADPLLGIGMLFMKTCEFGAGAVGITF